MHWCFASLYISVRVSGVPVLGIEPGSFGKTVSNPPPQLLSHVCSPTLKHVNIHQHWCAKSLCYPG